MEHGATSRNPDHHEYLLTAQGRDLAMVIVALTEWGDRCAAPAHPSSTCIRTVASRSLSRRSVPAAVRCRTSLR